MTGIVDSNSTGTTLVSYGHTYDAADRITQEVKRGIRHKKPTR